MLLLRLCHFKYREGKYSIRNTRSTNRTDQLDPTQAPVILVEMSPVRRGWLKKSVEKKISLA
jgi:hypothetical protein